jgi:SRSO17 transposase
VVHDDELARFTSTFRQRFAPLFGRKMGRQRAEQYLGGLLAARATRRNVTSLANTVEGATARALGWLLNKSPWEPRPVVDALQAYVTDVLGDEDAVFTVSLAIFVKRGDNAVGVERQRVPHVGRTQNCQVGVFLAYGSEQAFAGRRRAAAGRRPNGRAALDRAGHRAAAGLPRGPARGRGAVTGCRRGRRPRRAG